MDHSQDKKLNNVESDVQDLKSARKAEQIRRMMEEEELILWRIMLPPEHEGKGYGSEAVRLVINQAKDSGKYAKLTLTCSPDNLIARHVYEKAGFQPTGSILHDSIEMFIPLR